VRGLPTEPEVRLKQRLRTLPYFANNLAPYLRAAWIRFSARVAVGDSTHDDLIRLEPEDPAPSKPPEKDRPSAVVLDHRRVLLGAIESVAPNQPAFEAMNPGPQTIRPDMTLRLAAVLLRDNPYILVTDARGHYIGRYHPPTTARPDRARASGRRI
jgi:hypothetical protein